MQVLVCSSGPGFVDLWGFKVCVSWFTMWGVAFREFGGGGVLIKVLSRNSR